MTTPTLMFPEAWKPETFTTNVTSRQAGEPDPVIRELLQNCLDAAIREAGRDRAEIHFTISSRPLRQLPGYQEYVRAFKAAKAELTSPTTHDVLSAIRRVEQVLDSRRIRVLFCRDNGIGLDRKRMTALVAEGISDKARQGAGSYGLGHLTAFPASDLRYVLYAGKRGDTEIASGHAFLAGHKRKRTLYSGEGILLQPTDVFRLENFPSVVPEFLKDEIDQIASSGSVVAITGFNHFHNDEPTQALEDISRVAALNFLGAIWQRKMIVHVRDENTQQSVTVDADRLEEILAPLKQEERTSAGWLPGQQGYRSWQTLRDGSILDTQIDGTITVYFRPLPANTSERSRVQVFRDGMWITNSAPALNTGAFNSVQPFDAVVLLSDDDPDDYTEFYDLVRKSEGPEHRDLTKRRELPKDEKAKLQTMLRQLAERLREKAGRLDRDSGFTPAGFALFGGDVERVAERVRRPRRQPQDVSPEEDTQESATPGGAAVETGPAPHQPGTRSPRTTPRRGPAPGHTLRTRAVAVPRPDAEGLVRELTAELRVIDRLSPSDQLALRLRLQSGSDATCDQPVPDTWLPIAHVRVGDDRIDADGAFEVLIPHTAGRMTIGIAEPLRDTIGIELDIVRRRPQKARQV